MIFRVVFLILFFLIQVPLLAQAAPDPSEIRPGLIIFKISPEIRIDLEQVKVGRFGITRFDTFFCAIKADQIVPTFPHAEPPLTDGIDLTRIYTLSFPPAYSVQTVCHRAEKLIGVEYAQPWYLNKLDFRHNDIHRNRQWGLDICQANEAHNLTQGSWDVQVGIVDTGTELDHLDLERNIWVNPGEDLNGNIYIEPWEENGDDDDGNGFIDDFYGWDFVDDDNDPEDVAGAHYGHGTHVAGITSATTHNLNGVASLGFSCKIISIRAGTGNISHGYQGIVYAANCRTEVINCSWGGANAGRVEQEAVDYAYERDCVVFASAGNDCTDAPHFPSGLNHVISVAATNRMDEKAGFSNFGAAVDISAPGEGILSTAGNGTYLSWGGTSMASPFAASVAMLIRARFPNISVEETISALYAGAENINAENPDYINQLGVGRINAFRSLRFGPAPSVVVDSLKLTQANFNNPFREFALSATFTNISRGVPARELEAHLTCENRDLETLISNVDLPELVSGDQYINEENPFTFQILSDQNPESARFTINLFHPVYILEEQFTFELALGVWEQSVTSDSRMVAVPLRLSAYPNPFNQLTLIQYALRRPSRTTLVIYDPMGHLVSTLLDTDQLPGTYQINWDSQNIPAGIYFCRLNSTYQNNFIKLTVIK